MFERKEVLEGFVELPAAGTPELEQAYRACRELTKTASKTFYMASLFLGPEKRRAIWAIYAFCRTADDVVDQNTPAAARLATIDELERKLIAAVHGYAVEPNFVAYHDATKNFDVPLEPALDLLRGLRMDITIRRYPTYESLLDYCYHVASTIGLLVAPVLGYSNGALEYAVALGRAMQLTNILRDIGEDARMGRIYLPSEDLARFGYCESNVFEEVIDDSFVALMQFQIARVRKLYASAEPGIDLLSPESRYTVRLALALYSRILRAIELNRYDVFGKRAYVPFRSKVLTAMTLALAR